MREFGQQLSTIWLPFQKTQCFHGESSNGRFDDFGLSHCNHSKRCPNRSPEKARFRYRLYSLPSPVPGARE